MTNLGEDDCKSPKASDMLFLLLDKNVLVDTSYYAGFGAVKMSYSRSSGGEMIGTYVDYNLE
ncbi:MAG: hypothetical protein ACI9RU_000781 [Litorivivens sp.]|jgi:hypothetical protein